MIDYDEIAAALVSEAERLDRERLLHDEAEQEAS
jgi:hypothetical protein